MPDKVKSNTMVRNRKIKTSVINNKNMNSDIPEVGVNIINTSSNSDIKENTTSRCSKISSETRSSCNKIVKNRSNNKMSKSPSLINGNIKSANQLESKTSISEENDNKQVNNMPPASRASSTSEVSSAAGISLTSAVASSPSSFSSILNDKKDICRVSSVCSVISEQDSTSSTDSDGIIVKISNRELPACNTIKSDNVEASSSKSEEDGNSESQVKPSNSKPFENSKRRARHRRQHSSASVSYNYIGHARMCVSDDLEVLVGDSFSDDEYVETDPEKITAHPYRHVLDTLRMPEHMKKYEYFRIRPWYKTPCIIVATKTFFSKVLENLARQKIIGVTIKVNTSSYYSTRVCLMQISTRRRNYLIDTVELAESLHLLNKIFASPKTVKIIFGSETFFKTLQLEHNIWFVNVFDIRIAMRRLGWKNMTFKRFVEMHFQVEWFNGYIHKWHKRPLQKDYRINATISVHYLLPVYLTLKNEFHAITRNRKLLDSVFEDSNEQCATVFKPKTIETVFPIMRYLEASKVHAINKLENWRQLQGRKKNKNVDHVLNEASFKELIKHMPTDKDEIIRIADSEDVKNRINYIQQIMLEASKVIGPVCLMLPQNEEPREFPKPSGYVKPVENIELPVNVKITQNNRATENVKSAENVEQVRNVEALEYVSSARNVKPDENVKSPESVKQVRNVKALEYVSTARNVKPHENVKSSENVKQVRNVKGLEYVSSARNVKPHENVKSSENVKQVRNVKALEYVSSARNVKLAQNRQPYSAITKKEQKNIVALLGKDSNRENQMPIRSAARPIVGNIESQSSIVMNSNNESVRTNQVSLNCLNQNKTITPSNEIGKYMNIYSQKNGDKSHMQRNLDNRTNERNINEQKNGIQILTNRNAVDKKCENTYLNISISNQEKLLKTIANTNIIQGQMNKVNNHTNRNNVDNLRNIVKCQTNKNSSKKNLPSQNGVQNRNENTQGTARMNKKRGNRNEEKDADKPVRTEADVQNYNGEDGFISSGPYSISSSRLRTYKSATRTHTDTNVNNHDSYEPHFWGHPNGEMEWFSPLVVFQPYYDYSERYMGMAPVNVGYGNESNYNEPNEQYTEDLSQSCYNDSHIYGSNFDVQYGYIAASDTYHPPTPEIRYPNDK